MSTDTVITHTEALRLIDEQIGETVYIGFLVARADPDDPEGPTPFIHRIGPLENPLAPKPPRLDPDVGFYELGELFCFPPITGTIHLRDNGVDFRVADTVSIRIAWRGSKELGNHWTNPADVSQLFAKGQRARGEILEASPTEHKFGAGDDERRIWSLRVRVHPDDEPAFEARAEHGFQLSPDFETKIERGYSITMHPLDGVEFEVLYDPDNHEHVIVRPLDAGGEGGGEMAGGARTGIRVAGIVGLPIGDLEDLKDDDTPPRPQS